ncbi:hypothetical protein TcCL_NonESM09549 [Trypanosoma cruzi]|nr:hypothetical protein TcCL_NonESM09549 [Trypanosoma cruzi]
MGETRPCTAPLHFPTTQVLRVRTKSSKQNQSAHKPNHPPHLLNQIIRMEWHLSTKHQWQAAWNFPASPAKRQQLCGVKVTAPRCCPQSTWQEEFHARIVPDTSLFECPTEHKKIRAHKMTFK